MTAAIPHLTVKRRVHSLTWRRRIFYTPRVVIRLQRQTSRLAPEDEAHFIANFNFWTAPVNDSLINAPSIILIRHYYMSGRNVIRHLLFTESNQREVGVYRNNYCIKMKPVLWILIWCIVTCPTCLKHLLYNLKKCNSWKTKHRNWI